MSLKPIVKGERISLVSPADRAIDREATPADALSAYTAGDFSRQGDLRFLDGEEPTRFELKAQTPLEARVVQRALMPSPPDELEQLTIEQNQALARGEAKLLDFVTDPKQMLLHSLWLETVCLANLRVALVDVHGLDGWGFKRQAICGIRAWPLEALGVLDDDTRNFLGAAAVRLGQFDAEKKSPSGS